jgi:hypothetical protein
MQRRPSMQMLLNNTTVLAGKSRAVRRQVHLGFEDSAETTQPLNRCYLSEPSYFKPFCSLGLLRSS